jgi:molybdopterin-synthase adenylyltransferase
VTFSVAMPGPVHDGLSRHLLRADGQEDVCLAIYAPSTGCTRTSALVSEFLLPGPGERAVHGNASFTGGYFVHAASHAASLGRGVVALHSHPGGAGWQPMSGPDYDTERSYARLVHEVTGLRLVGMTLAGEGNWSARRWDPSGIPEHGESVRIIDDRFRVTWNDRLRPAPAVGDAQVRTVSAWGETAQASLVRIRVLVVGVSSVGLDVALRLAATGIMNVGVMDFDSVQIVNLDRMIGATMADVRLARSKVEVAGRLMARAATAEHPQIAVHDLSICEPAGLAAVLDYDIVVSCVDRPWARGVLNTVAFADLVPVLDGGIGIDAFDDGQMRNAVWRSHALVPGRPCLVCNGQLDAADIQTDKLGLLDDPEYIRGASTGPHPRRQNVAALAASVSSSLLAQFVSLTVTPGGIGAPGPLRYALSTHTLEHLDITSKPHCPFEVAVATGAGRVPLTGHHAVARKIQEERSARQARPAVRLRRRLSGLADWLASR